MAEEQLGEGLAGFVETFLRADLTQMAERGFEPPLALTVEDEEGIIATAQIDEDWNPVECIERRAPKYPFVVKIVDCNRKGAQFEFLAQQ